ncbi:hypothetical protein RIEGSTA812A_PEG_984 [invertebrate metagenome]|uniref:Uncharacterized protein n=1 Tax=invertebrate metagenome TaxID=1711999 RepID=A0A484H7J3_9ZZZZ
MDQSVHEIIGAVIYDSLILEEDPCPHSVSAPVLTLCN